MTDTGFGWILLACLLWGLLHSALASIAVKALTAGWLGADAYQRYYRLFFVIAAVVTALPLPALGWLLPNRAIYAIPRPWVYLTLLLQALALLALAVGVLQTGAMRFLGIAQIFQPPNTNPDDPPQDKLVVNGLYRWVRHPLYTASFVLLWLTPVMTWNGLALSLGLTIYTLVGTIFEERKLVRQFGQAYQAYRKRTPRIIPGIW